jgi:zinc transport system substrate-binding protein
VSAFIRNAALFKEIRDMRTRTKLFFAMVTIVLLGLSLGDADASKEENVKNLRSIVASDTILSGMIVSLLPSTRYAVEAILPPGQCPGHYDVKLSDIEKLKKADLVVSFRGMPFMEKAGPGGRMQLLVDAGGRNWMAPDSYVFGLGFLAGELSKSFPKDKVEIMKRKEEVIRKVKTGANLLLQKVKRTGISGKPMIASAMQREPLEWMGLRVVGEYGRPEAMSARDVVRLAKIGRDQQAIAVVDNLQSGPDAGKGIAEAMGAPHVVLTNFPSERGYLSTLEENVDAVLAAVIRK